MALIDVVKDDAQNSDCLLKLISRKPMTEHETAMVNSFADKILPVRINTYMLDKIKKFNLSEPMVTQQDLLFRSAIELLCNIYPSMRTELESQIKTMDIIIDIWKYTENSSLLNPTFNLLKRPAFLPKNHTWWL